MNGVDASEGKDPAIKLFGKTIPVPECHLPTKHDEKSDLGCQIPGKSEVTDMNSQITKIKVEDFYLKESGKQHKSSIENDVIEEDMQLTGDESQANVKHKEDETETSSVDQEKVLKKPDKILPCPRCNSFDTKFCYFNNYNVNQPRHFCKNCQRYWTAGGTMRSVPVGAGRRKNKHLASQFRQILVPPGTVPASNIEISQNSANQQLFSCDESRSTASPLASNGTVLKFGPEGHLCESMATVLHLADQKSFVAELGSSMVEREDSSSCGSFVTVSTVQENQSPAKTKEESNLHGSCNGLTQPNPLQCFPVPPWVFPWNQVWNSGAPMVAARCSSELVSSPNDGSPNPVQWCSTPMLAGPGFCTPSIPLQFVPAPYWGCLPVWTAGASPLPMVGSNGVQSPSSSTSNSCSGNNSSNLGKHSRDENLMNEEKSGKCVLVPKTLRVDDPDEASRSSIWATLGLKSNQQENGSRCGIFKPYKSITVECKGPPSDTTQVLEANPAACSRSHTFQEST